MSSDIRALMFAKYLDSFEDFLQGETQVTDPENLYRPVDYVISMGGKRVRPLLCLLTYAIFDDEFKKVYPQAAAIEMFHNFTLVHDDIMDQAPLRRGHAAVHQKFGLDHAILSGDAMLIMAYQLLARNLPHPVLNRTLEVFSDAALKICEGQQYDMDFQNMDVIKLNEYLRMIEYKTAVLLGASMAIGGICAECSVEEQDLLWKCGVALGMAFQIQDDLLDIFGQSESTGKQIGGDILQQKQTIVWLKAMDLSGPRQEAELISLYQAKNLPGDDKIRQVLGIYQSLGVETHCQAMKERYVREGMGYLEKINVDENRFVDLIQLFQFLLNRSN